jgi:glyoxalase family protein
MPILSGLHHVTAISGDAQRNAAFYTDILGLRLVKRTVNFDDPGSYHLYYGDLVGNPGTILTFFVWPGATPGQAGTGTANAIAFSVPSGSSEWWKARLQDAGITVQDQGSRFGEPILAFRDSDQMKLELIETAKPQANRLRFWVRGPIPEAHAIRGIHYVTLEHVSVHDAASSFAPYLGFSLVKSSDGLLEEGLRRFAITKPEVAGFVDIVTNSASRRGRMGAGTIHHIAFRTADDKSQLEWQQALLQAGYHVSEVKDRTYFHSIYFRERGGVLFEIATDPPGFTIDETEDTLGEALKLPKQYKPLRPRLEASLPPIHPVQV